MSTYRIKRIYEDPAAEDGARVLVDRIWPRGVSKAEAGLDQWAKDLAPSTELRQWFGHREDRFEEFSRKYRRELDESEAAQSALADLPDAPTVTFLYAAKDPELNQAVVLREYCAERA